MYISKIRGIMENQTPIMGLVVIFRSLFKEKILLTKKFSSLSPF